MRVRIEPGGTLRGEVVVPGDKSIAHRWLMLASTATGRSRLVGLPGSLDVRSTASCLAALIPPARPSLEDWVRESASRDQGDGFTWHGVGGGRLGTGLEVEGDGREGLRVPNEDLDCGNSGTTMRLLSGVVAGAPFRTVLRGDESLRHDLAAEDAAAADVPVPAAKDVDLDRLEIEQIEQIRDVVTHAPGGCVTAAS